MSDLRDRELGMYRKITRRDFLDGTAMAIGGAAVARVLVLADSTATASASSGQNPLLHQEGAARLPSYPPALAGLRGDQDKVFEFTHKLPLRTRIPRPGLIRMRRLMRRGARLGSCRGLTVDSRKRQRKRKDLRERTPSEE